MSLEKEIRQKLINEAADYKKLDQLVRQGMMSPAQLPMLHRGLDKLQSGKPLNPQEREAVNKVMQSMLFIVTGDSQVFNKARQHTQKTRYQTESYTEEEVRELCHSKDHDCAVVVNHPEWGLGKPIYESHAIPDDEGNVEWYDVQFKHGIEKEVPAADMEILQSEGHEKTMYASTKKGKAKNSKQQAAIAIAKKEKGLDEYGMMTASTKKRKKKKPNVYAMAAEESPAEDKMDSGYKAKFQAMLKKTGKSLKDMSDEEKKKFFNAVDASHSAKDESVNEEDIKEYITSKQVKMAKGIAFDKRHKGGDMTGAAKKMEKIKKGLSNHPGAKKALRQANEEEENGKDYDPDKDHTMDPKSHVKKEGDKYCVYNKDGKKVKQFDSKAEAEAYAVKNHDALMELKMHPQHGAIKKYAKAKASDTFKRTFGAVGDGGPEGDTSKARAAGKKVLRKLKKPLAKTGMAKAANKAAKKSSDRMIDLTRQDSGSSEPVKKMSNKQRKDQMKTGMYPDANDKEYRKNVEEVEEAVLRKNFDSQPNPTMMKKSTMDKAKGLNVKVVKPKNQKSKNDLMFQGKSSDLKKLGSKLSLPLPKKEEIEENYEKGRGPTGIAFAIKKGHPDAENPKTRKKYPERQTPEYKKKFFQNNKEETEDLEELKQSTMKSYIGKAQKQVTDTEKFRDYQNKSMGKMNLSKGDKDFVNKKMDKDTLKRRQGIKTAMSKMSKEETEGLEERNKENAMKRKMMDASRGARYKLNNPNVPDSGHKTPQAQNKAIGRALRSFEDANSDSMEKQQVMNRKMKRKSDANARKERETDQGFKAAMKESLIDKVVEKLGEGAFKRMVTDKQEKERLAKMKKPQGNNRSYMTPKVDKYGRSNKMYFHPSEDAQSDARRDARRDAKMDSRGLAQTKKDKPDMQHKGKKAGDEKDGGHIVMQLRKAVSINKPVKFKDGKSHNISKADAHKYLNKYMQAKKPADKEKMHSAHDSHDAFKKHL